MEKTAARDNSENKSRIQEARKKFKNIAITTVGVAIVGASLYFGNANYRNFKRIMPLYEKAQASALMEMGPTPSINRLTRVAEEAAWNKSSGESIRKAMEDVRKGWNTGSVYKGLSELHKVADSAYEGGHTVAMAKIDAVGIAVSESALGHSE